MSGSWRPAHLLLLAVLLAICGVTAGKLDHAYVWDDIDLYETNVSFFEGSGALWRVWSSSLVETMGREDRSGLNTYRPVSTTTMWLDGVLAPENTRVMRHMTSLVLHLVTVILVYLLGRVAGLRDWTSAVAAGVFGLHPWLAEAHVYLSGRTDLVATLMSVSTILVWARWRCRTTVSTITTILLYGLAYLSKEPAALMVIIIAAWEWVLPSSSSSLPKRMGRHVAPLLIGVIGASALRSQVLGGLSTHSHPDQLRDAAASVGLVLFDGLGQALVPQAIAVRYLHEEFAAVGSGVRAVAIVGVLAVAAGLIVARRRYPLLGLSMFWFWVTLAPVAIISTMMWGGFGRYLDLPLAGLVLGIGALMQRAEDMAGAVSDRSGKLVAIGQVALLAILAAQLHASVPQWADPYALYTHLSRTRPAASWGPGGIGTLALRDGRPGEAIPYLEAALELNPTYDRWLNNLGIAYRRSGDRARCRAIAEHAVPLHPSMAKFPYLRALCAAAPDDSARWVVATLRVDATHDKALDTATWLVSGEFSAEARAVFADAIRDDPQLDAVLGSLAAPLNRPGVTHP